MQTIKDLLNKIKWDEKENTADYSLGYLDRIKNEIVVVKMDELLDMDEFSITIDENGKAVQIPLHRIKVVEKKGIIIWKRDY